MSAHHLSFQAGWLAVTSLASYGAGLLRDRFLAARFGAGMELDVYNSAFIVPDFIMNFFAAALTTAFIPVFTMDRQKQGMAAAWEGTNVIISCLLVVIVIAIGGAYVAMPWLSSTIAPGFESEAKVLLVRASRLMLLSPLAFALSIAIGCALQGMQRFLTYALSPVLYNAGIIVGILFLAPRFGVLGVVMGVVIGGFLHMIIRYVELRFFGWRWQWRFQWQHQTLRKTVRLMIPRLFSLLTVQTNLWLYNALASTLVAGSIAVFNLGRNFQSLPVSLFAIALATVLFPRLSEHFATTAKEELVELAERAIRQLVFFTVPVATGMAIVAYPLISTFLGSGEFDEAAVRITSLTLAVFAIAIPFESVQHVLARVFYAQHDTRTPLKIAIIGMLVNIVVCVATLRVLGVIGLVVGFIMTTVTQVILLYVTLRRRGQFVLRRTTVVAALKVMAISGIMGGIVWVSVSLVHQSWLQLLSAAGLGLVSFIVMSYLLRLPELQTTLAMVQRLWKSVRVL